MPFCGSQSGRELLLTVQEDPFVLGILPLDNVSRVTWDVFSLVFSRLLRHGDSGLEPDLAESWETSADTTEWTVHLRQDARFHDGSRVTAQDVSYSITASRRFKL